MNILLQIILASFFVSLSSFAGVILLFRKKWLQPKYVMYLVSFAAGVILTTALLDLLPEALHHGEEGGVEFNVFLPVFIGILVSFFLERILLFFHHHDHNMDRKEHRGSRSIAILILLSDGMHNFIDGVVIAATFLTNPALGVATTIAIAAHEIPHEIADFSVLIHSGMSKKRALFFNFLSSLTALVGAIGAYYFLQKIDQIVPALLAFSGGMFIYIACSDLIPELNEEFKKDRNFMQITPFIIGIILMYVSISLLHGGH